MKKTFYDIRNSKGVAEIIIYKPIGGGDFEDGFGANRFIKDFRTITENEVLIRINSPGGSLLEAITIYNVLRDSNKKITTKIDGSAASAASVIFMAGDKRIMPTNTNLLIHNPWTYATGDEKEFLKTASWLKKWKDQLCEIYAETTGLDTNEISELMEKETLFSAKEAYDKGFCNEIVKAADIAAQYHLYNQLKLNDKLNSNTNNKECDMEEEIKKLKEKLEGKENEIKNLQKQLEIERNNTKQVEIEAKIDKDIAAKKILPKARNVAIKILAASEEDYKDFLETYEMPTLDNVHIEDGKPTTEMTFEYLLDNPEKLHNVRNNNPKLFEELYKKFVRGE